MRLVSVVLCAVFSLSCAPKPANDAGGGTKCWTSADCKDRQVCVPPSGDGTGELNQGTCQHYDTPMPQPTHAPCSDPSDCATGETCVAVPCVVAPCPSYCTKL